MKNSTRKAHEAKNRNIQRLDKSWTQHWKDGNESLYISQMEYDKRQTRKETIHGILTWAVIVIIIAIAMLGTFSVLWTIQSLSF